MSIDSTNLEAFVTVARLGNFTTAASQLHISQPALSRRIQSLESELGTVVFLRKPRELELTAAGRRLLRYAETKALLESELADDLTKSESKEPKGLVRIAGYSSILHSVVTPSIGGFLRKNTQVTIEYEATQSIRPVERQTDLLLRSEIDILLTIVNVGNRDLICEKLGEVKLIGIESSKYNTPDDLYLDTRPEDPTTSEYLKRQRLNPTKLRRSFLYDEEGIIRGVMEGIGRAVVFSSQLKAGMPIKEIRSAASMTWPIYLVYRKQSHYLPAVEGITQAILKSGRRFLD